MTFDPLPPSWSVAPLAALGAWRGGGTPAKDVAAFWTGGAIPWVSPKDMKQFTIHDAEDRITREAVEGSATNVVEAGSVLIVTRSGILRRILPVAVNEVPVAINQDLKALELHDGIESRYVAWALRRFEQEILHKCVKGGTTVQSVVFPKLLQFEVPLAPAAEQSRIVAAIEEHFSRIDAGVQALERARRNLRRMRAAVLEAAVEGTLVAPTGAEASHVTLKRLAATRGDQPNGQKKQKGPDVISLAADLPPLPVGWTWTTVYELRGPDSAPVLTGPFGTTLGRADFKDHGVPLLTIGCLTERGVVLDKALYVTEDKAASLARYRLQPGDLLFSRMATVGRVGIVTERETGALMNYHLMRLRLAQNVLLPEYLAIYIRGSPIVQAYVRTVNHGVTRDGINTTQLLAMPVALPPLDDQQRITEEVERRFWLLDKLEVAVLANIQRSSRLRRAVLSRGFEGRLVPQDPSDEPAQVFLDRIRTARTAEDFRPNPPRRRFSR